ncbi:hypothetical protein F4778DRAFT_585579 [Xylariomycetidae sp. FL2044]|nr:hypothetical protein F4778DRAFT_585579 [Xylariomycetidae sp. FL2044]
MLSLGDRLCHTYYLESDSQSNNRLSRHSPGEYFQNPAITYISSMHEPPAVMVSAVRGIGTRVFGQLLEHVHALRVWITCIYTKVGVEHGQTRAIIHHGHPPFWCRCACAVCSMANLHRPQVDIASLDITHALLSNSSYCQVFLLCRSSWVYHLPPATHYPISPGTVSYPFVPSRPLRRSAHHTRITREGVPYISTATSGIYHYKY